MPDASTTVEELKDAMRRFAAARHWQPYHSPKNLVMALAVEVSELAEHFLWVDDEESHRVVSDPARREDIADELADVAGLVLQFSHHADIDLASAIENKLRKNESKYPAPASD